jgi:DNA-binding XRE family transcriptional regulator
MHAARRAIGMTQANAATAAGVSVSLWCQLEQGKLRPHDDAGNWKATSAQIAALLGVSCEELWPMAAARRQMLAVHLREQWALGAPVLPDEVVDVVEFRSAARQAVDRLSLRERYVLIQRLEGSTYDDMASFLGCPYGRVRILHGRALRRLRGDASLDGYGPPPMPERKRGEWNYGPVTSAIFAAAVTGAIAAYLGATQ